MSTQITEFAALGLPAPLLSALTEVGYETPSPIQAQAIPVLLAGRDIIGQAQTGTGKTAAFALPLLARIDPSANHPQLLVLAPTRELALQVAEAMQTYARFLSGFHVLPIYGGQGMGMQLNQLRRGVQVVVGTPGRIMDHMRRGTLDISRLQALVLDEADEMLRMGFIDDVEWILEHVPEQRQVALFSATMPAEIRAVAARHLHDPQHIQIAAKTTTAENIRQRFWAMSGLHKLDALTRILENEVFDGVIIFVRTKTQTVELAERLSARGFAAEALNGDVPQAQRERTVDRLRDGKLDILVATDVVARGLDVKRVTHVINYDIPYDVESYVHRIGRTGRAGAAGEAILFVAPRERRMLHTIEKATGQRIQSMDLPTVQDINTKRTERFKAGIREAIASEDLSLYYRLVSELEQEEDLDALQIAAALARLAQGEVPLLLDASSDARAPAREAPGRRAEGEARRSDRAPASRAPKAVEHEALPLKDFPEIEMERFRIAVGYQHGVKPGNIVGAIANEAELESRYIGHIEIHDDFSTVDLPAGMPEETLRDLQKTWVCQQRLAIQRLKDFDPHKVVAPPKRHHDKPPKRDGGESDEGAPRPRGTRPKFGPPPRGDGPRPRRRDAQGEGGDDRRAPRPDAAKARPGRPRSAPGDDRPPRHTAPGDTEQRRRPPGPKGRVARGGSDKDGDGRKGPQRASSPAKARKERRPVADQPLRRRLSLQKPPKGED